MTALALPENIADICAGRDAARDHWLAAFDAYQHHTSAAAKACIGAISLPVPSGYRFEDGAMTEAFVGGKREKFDAMMTVDLDRRCWRTLMERLGTKALLDRQAREEFETSIRDAPPAFTVENCVATFGHIYGNRRSMFLRGIANAFSRLDRRFRSHDGFKVGSRLIVENALDIAGWRQPHWRNFERRDTFHDIERLLSEVDGKPAPIDAATRKTVDGSEPVPDSERSVIARLTEVRTADLPIVVQGAYFRVRVFKNGNLHIWFENDDLLRAVNKLLAEYYGELIGDSYDSTEVDDTPGYHVTPAKNFGAFNTSPELASRIVDVYASIGKGMRVLEPSAGTGELAKAARSAGAEVTCVEIQPGLAHELRVLQGFEKVVEADFLAVEPHLLPQFDAIIMNPPFDRGRDCDHVRHAFQFLKPGGQLIAIMSARAEHREDKRHKALHKLIAECESPYGRHHWHDLPAGSFAHAGTMVNTVVLTLRKPQAMKVAA